MNIEICREKCGRGARVTYVDKKNWMVVIEGVEAERCSATGWITTCTTCTSRIEPCNGIFRKAPDGWALSKGSYGSRLYKCGGAKSDRVLWGLRMVPEEYGCPYLLEHTMSEIRHAERVGRSKRYMQSCREAMKRRIRDAKADGEKLP